MGLASAGEWMRMYLLFEGFPNPNPNLNPNPNFYGSSVRWGQYLVLEGGYSSPIKKSTSLFATWPALPSVFLREVLLTSWADSSELKNEYCFIFFNALVHLWHIFQNCQWGGTWVAQWVEARVLGSSPASCSMLSVEPASSSLSLPAYLPTCDFCLPN